ncbi:MAG TPA: hypothetical protein VIL64_03345 [Solirubrobacteraceae bacterium]
MVLAADAFVVITFVGVAFIVGSLLLIGWLYPGTGADQLRWRPTRSPEVEAENELDDIDQMLDAANERRRASGRPERTLEDVELDVGRAQHEQAKRQEALMAEQERDTDIEELLALKNERRARKGLPPLTRESYEASLRNP